MTAIEFLRPRVAAKLDRMAARLQELTAMAASPDVLARPDRLRSVQKELGSLQRTVDLYERYRTTVRELDEHRALSGPQGDPELAELAEAEMPALKERARALSLQLIDALLAEESDGNRDAILEIRAGTGGEEAALWARDLLGMYGRFAAEMGWKVEPISESRSDMDGFKEVVVSISGDRVFDFLRFESGGHRVQRVPATEAQGRIHTSAATVAVLPEAEDVEVDLKDADIDFQAVRASGPGGQNVNKVSSAVRLTHRPSGMVVFCQEERSQLKNKQKALKLLRSRLYDLERQRVDAARAADRKSQVGSGDRSERVRTYNFPQNRVTDHRLGQNFALETVLEGKLRPISEALVARDRERRIEEL